MHSNSAVLCEERVDRELPGGAECNQSRRPDPPVGAAGPFAVREFSRLAVAAQTGNTFGGGRRRDDGDATIRCLLIPTRSAT